MSLTFLTPTAALLAFGVVVPLAVFVFRRRHARRVRGRLGLGEPARRRLVVALGSLFAAAALVGLAAAQPVLERDTTLHVRTDAEVFVVLDITRSMLAQTSVSAPMRIDRAKEVASTYRASVPTVRVGLASLTDRVLPHLFPSPDEETFRSTVAGALGIERPPPRENLSVNATTLEALTGLAVRRFFSRGARHRLAVVLTDGESRAVNEISVAAALRRPPAVETVFVHVWDEGERVYSQGVPEAEYRPDTTARDRLDRLADANDGGVYSEDELGAAVAKSRELLGEGPSVVETAKRERRPLAPYLAAAAFLPLAFLLGRLSR